jgi:hypothetical protein
MPQMRLYAQAGAATLDVVTNVLSSKAPQWAPEIGLGYNSAVPLLTRVGAAGPLAASDAYLNGLSQASVVQNAATLATSPNLPADLAPAAPQ